MRWTSTLRVSPVSLGFCSRHSWILSPTPAQRTQRTHHPTEGNVMYECSRFSRLSFVVGLDTRNQRNLLPLLPSSFTTSKPVTFTKHAHSPKSFAQGSTDTFTTPLLRQLLPTGTPHLSPLYHWELEAGRTCEKGEAGSEDTLGRYSSRSGFGVRFNVWNMFWREAIKYSSLSAQYTVTRHPWPEWMRRHH